MNGPTCIVPAWLPACWADILGYVVWCVPQWENDFFFFPPPACLQQQPLRVECRVASGCSQHSANELMARTTLCVCQWRTYTEATSSGVWVGLLYAHTHQECRSRDVFRSRMLNKGSNNAVVHILRGLETLSGPSVLNAAFTLPPLSSICSPAHFSPTRFQFHLIFFIFCFTPPLSSPLFSLHLSSSPLLSSHLSPNISHLITLAKKLLTPTKWNAELIIIQLPVSLFIFLFFLIKWARLTVVERGLDRLCNGISCFFFKVWIGTQNAGGRTACL